MAISGEGCCRWSCQARGNEEEEEVYGCVVRVDMQMVGATEEDAEDRRRWKHMIICGDP